MTHNTQGTTTGVGLQLDRMLGELSKEQSTPEADAIDDSPCVRLPSDPATPQQPARQGSMRDQQEAALRARMQSMRLSTQPTSSSSPRNVGPKSLLVTARRHDASPFKASQASSFLSLVSVAAPHLSTGDMRQRWDNEEAFV